MGQEKDLSEGTASRLTRNWGELLQELRVTQTGVQILTGFLLTVPFSTRFGQLTAFQRHAYLTALTGSVLSTILLLTPAACHRVLFRHGERPWLVTTAQRMALAGMIMVALTTSAVVTLVFDVVLGHGAAWIAGLVALVVFTLFWILLPLSAYLTDD